MLKLGACLFTKDNLRARASRDLLMPADEVGVQVRFDHILDLQPLRLGLREILINITLRIDNRSLTLRPNQVRSMRQASKIELFKVHRIRVYPCNPRLNL